MVEQGAAPAGEASQATHSGGAGAPPGVTRDPCQELADRRFSPRSEAREAKRGPASNKRRRRCAERRLAVQMFAQNA